MSMLAPIHTIACAGSSFLGFPTWDTYLLCNSDGSPQINALSDVWLIVFPIVETLIRLGGLLAVVFIVWGAVKYILSHGNPSAVSGAKSTIFNAIIGLVICIVAVAVVRFVAGVF